MKTVNDYRGMTDNEMIEAAIADRENGIVVIGQRKSDIEPERDFWLLDRAILLPENTTVILQNCKIKLSDKCRDNFFRSANCGIGIEDIQPIQNIHIKGVGLCVLEGADHPRAVGDSSKTLHCPCPKTREDIIKYAYWVPEERRTSGNIDFWDEHNHSYGTDAGKEGEVQHGDWRGIGILFARVSHFSIENIRMVDTHGWAISLEDCAHGRLEHIDFEMYMAKMIDGMLCNMENQDGIDLRNGCHDILINDITGGTGDDLIALTAIANRSLPVRPDGTLQSTHIMGNDWTKRETDIYNIIIRNVRGMTLGRICLIIRLLPAGAYIRNVVIDGVVDTTPDGFESQSSVMQLGDGGGYGENFRDSMQNITVSNVICNSSRGIRIDGYMCNSSFTNIVNRNPNCKAITVKHEDGIRNVKMENIVESGA